jgi:hypothetical protein
MADSHSWIERHGLCCDAESLLKDPPLLGVYSFVEWITGYGTLMQSRKGQREDALRRAIEEQFISHEERSREHGWSYTQELVNRHLDKWTPPRATVERKTSSKRADPTRSPKRTPPCRAPAPA